MDPLFELLGKFVAAGGGIAALSFAIFRALGSKWLDHQFAERLQALKTEQDQHLRVVQSTIDREIHRAKKLYDTEFTALPQCWQLLCKSYEVSVSARAILVRRVVEDMSDAEFYQFLGGRGMDEWERRTMVADPNRAALYEEWREATELEKRTATHETFASYFAQNSIFFADGFPQAFSEIAALIKEADQPAFHFVDAEGNRTRASHQREETLAEKMKRLNRKGDKLMAQLQEMVRQRLWSVAADSPDTDLGAASPKR